MVQEAKRQGAVYYPKQVNSPIVNGGISKPHPRPTSTNLGAEICVLLIIGGIDGFYSNHALDQGLAILHSRKIISLVRRNIRVSHDSLTFTSRLEMYDANPVVKI